MNIDFEQPSATATTAVSPLCGTSSQIDWVPGTSAAMRRIAQHAYRAAEVECTVLISGETGTGKEVWARAVLCASQLRGLDQLAGREPIIRA